MEGFKEFQGKDLDSAIEEACGYFNTAREKLEIEIVQDSKSGIFGIVGARKAKVRARRVQLREAVENILGRKGGAAPSADTPADASAEAAGEPVAGADGKGEASRQREDSRPSAPRQEKRHDRPRGRKGAQEEGLAVADAAAEPAAARSESPRDAERPAGNGSRKSDKKNDKAGGRGSEKNTARNDDKGVRQNGAAKSGDENGACHSEKAAETATGAGKNGEKSDRASGRGQSGQAENGRRGEGRGRKGDPRDSRDSREGREGRSAAREGGRDAARQARPGTADMLDDDFEEAAEGLPVTPLEQLDQERLMALVHETVRSLVRPIVGEAVQLEAAVVGGRVQVGIESEEDSGLLIGREGQTLAALQYMISRIVSRGMNAAVRVQLDAGEYRRRQDERLREMALALADKVRQSGRSYSTRPLSSYHRRIVHVCLQDATDVQTRSTGDGPLKRVVILRRKTEKN